MTRSPADDAAGVAVAFAHPRAGLLGNPSDGYGGRVLAFAFTEFAARATVSPAHAFGLGSAGEADVTVADLAQLRPRDELSGKAALLGATLLRFAAAAQSASRRVAPCRLHVESDIPRQVGLAGSSAIVIAALRALATRYRVPLPPAELAATALAIENDDLGIAAGPQDRLVQAHQGLLWMDFGAPPHVESVSPTMLPLLFVAWDPAPGTSSAVVHDDVRRRYVQGDPAVRGAMARFPLLADRGLSALRRGDLATLRAAMNENFDTRATICSIGARDRELIAIGRTGGAATKFAGSGGAIVGLPATPDDLGALRAAYERAGFGFVLPTLALPIPEAAP